MAKVKLVKRGKPGPAGGPKKWYGLSVSGRPLVVRQMTRQATRNTSLSPMEMEAALDLFGDYAVAPLLQGRAVGRVLWTHHAPRNMPDFPAFRDGIAPIPVEASYDGYTLTL